MVKSANVSSVFRLYRGVLLRTSVLPHSDVLLAPRSTYLNYLIPIWKKIQVDLCDRNPITNPSTFDIPFPH
jgi:hypothetical protein